MNISYHLLLHHRAGLDPYIQTPLESVEARPSWIHAVEQSNLGIQLDQGQTTSKLLFRLLELLIHFCAVRSAHLGSPLGTNAESGLRTGDRKLRPRPLATRTAADVRALTTASTGFTSSSAGPPIS
jgi:hypothetical protein